MVCRVWDLGELGIWARGIGGPDPKALQFLGGRNFPYCAKQHFPETAPCSDSGTGKAGAPIWHVRRTTCTPKRKNPNKHNCIVRSWRNFQEETQSARLNTKSSRDPSWHFQALDTSLSYCSNSAESHRTVEYKDLQRIKKLSKKTRREVHMAVFVMKDKW